jgi:NAD(P)-dependent dehydrogenase (short-subunit alcohol dehydrogenase family)
LVRLEVSVPLVLVTGATDGIGRETARQLAARGAEVVVHGRDAARVEAVGGAHGAVADLASLAAVRGLAADLLARFPRIDAVVHNAGVFAKRRVETVDGFELTNAVHHLAPLLLTHLLLPALRAAPQPRVVFVASMAHLRGTIDPADLDLRRRFDGHAAYAQSKLANVLTAVELARRLPGFAVNSLHPGVVNTKLLREGFGSGGSESLAEGARTSVALAVDPAFAGVSGKYFSALREARPSPLAGDADLCRRVYEASCAAVGVDPL